MSIALFAGERTRLTARKQTLESQILMLSNAISDSSTNQSRANLGLQTSNSIGNMLSGCYGGSINQMYLDYDFMNQFMYNSNNGNWLEQTKKILETELEMVTAQLKSVEDECKKQAKEVAPKFAGGQ